MATQIVGTLGVKLADGTEYRYQVAKLPRNWKSWVMQQVPYGASFQGCTWIRERVSA